MFAVSKADAPGTRKLLNLVLVLTIVDLVLLAPLVLGMVGAIDSESFKMGLGMTHGLVFVALVAITGLGALQKRWNWIFPIGTVIFGGVIFPLVVDVLIRRDLDAANDASVPAEA